MTAPFARRRISLTVGRRLFLGLLPSLLAVALAAGLFYYGEYGREAPSLFVIGAAILAAASLAMTWANTRYLAGRISRLAGAMRSDDASALAGSDELDRIEQVVDRLGSALSLSEEERARAEALATSGLREQAILLAATVKDATRQLDEIRLPLHILLESRFGDLNENQEELLRDARTAADAMDAALRRLGEIADADRGALPVQRDLVQVNDVVRAMLPLAHAAAQRHDARVETSLEPGLPRVVGDRARLAEALTLFATRAAASARPDRPVTVSTARERGGVTITIAPGAPAIDTTPAAGGAKPGGPAATDEAGVAAAERLQGTTGEALAGRLIVAQGGSVEETAAGTTIRLGPRTSAD